jgi:hypothetical protein
MTRETGYAKGFIDGSFSSGRRTSAAYEREIKALRESRDQLYAALSRLMALYPEPADHNDGCGCVVHEAHRALADASSKMEATS